MIDRAKLHPHPHGDAEAHNARTAERLAIRAAVAAKKAEAAKGPPPRKPPQQPQAHQLDHEGRRPEARNAFINIMTWYRGMVLYVDVKTLS